MLQEKTTNTLFIEPIGLIRTPYIDKYQAPRQPTAGKESIEGIITLFPYKNYEQALDDLNGFDKIWIISWFDRNTDWKPKVLPPRSGRTKRGVFSTRSPHRPNPIGISVCTLLGITGLKIRVENPDLLDRTPILDIKPYIPYADSFPDARAGWIEHIHSSAPIFSLVVHSKAKEQIYWLLSEYGIDFMDHITKTLSNDPLPHPFRRIKKLENGRFMMSHKSWRICYEIKNSVVEIHKIESGYSRETLNELTKEDAQRNNKKAHSSFLKLWGK